MKAVLMTKVGGPDVLHLEDISQPEIQSVSDVLVKLKAAGVNPVDAKLRHGLYPIKNLPVILGCDGAGIVEAVGSKVTRVVPGDEVYFYHGGTGLNQGNYAEYTVLDERFIAKKPESLSFVQAAAAPLVLITAWESLFDRTQVSKGKSVLIHAGAGGVGHVAIQLAKHADAKVCTTVSSPEKIKYVTELGADLAINYKEQDFVEAVMEWTNGKGVDIAMDNVGGPLIEATFPAIKHYGDMVTLLQADNSVNWTEARMRNIRFSMEIMLSPALFGLVEAQHHQTEILEKCAALFDNGELKIHVSNTFPLENIQDAHRRIEAGTTTGKIVIEI